MVSPDSPSGPLPHLSPLPPNSATRSPSRRKRNVWEVSPVMLSYTRYSPQPTSPYPRLVQGFLDSLPKRPSQHLPPSGPALSRLLVTALSDLLKVRPMWLPCPCPLGVCDPLKVQTFVTAYKKDRFTGTQVSFAQICELEGERPVRVL